jgi:hypothetical protein
VADKMLYFCITERDLPTFHNVSGAPIAIIPNYTVDIGKAAPYNEVKSSWRMYLQLWASCDSA